MSSLIALVSCLLFGHREPSWVLAAQIGVKHAPVCPVCLRPITSATPPAASGRGR